MQRRLIPSSLVAAFGALALAASLTAPAVAEATPTGPDTTAVTVTGRLPTELAAVNQVALCQDGGCIDRSGASPVITTDVATDTDGTTAGTFTLQAAADTYFFAVRYRVDDTHDLVGYLRERPDGFFDVVRDWQDASYREIGADTDVELDLDDPGRSPLVRPRFRHLTERFPSLSLSRCEHDRTRLLPRQGGVRVELQTRRRGQWRWISRQLTTRDGRFDFASNSPRYRTEHRSITGTPRSDGYTPYRVVVARGKRTLPGVCGSWYSKIGRPTA